MSVHDLGTAHHTLDKRLDEAIAEHKRGDSLSFPGELRTAIRGFLRAVRANPRADAELTRRAAFVADHAGDGTSFAQAMREIVEALGGPISSLPSGPASQFPANRLRAWGITPPRCFEDIAERLECVEDLLELHGKAQAKKLLEQHYEAKGERIIHPRNTAPSEGDLLSPEVMSVLVQGRDVLQAIVDEAYDRRVKGCELLVELGMQQGAFWSRFGPHVGPLLEPLKEAANSLVQWVEAEVEAEKLRVGHVLRKLAGDGDPEQTPLDPIEKEGGEGNREVVPPRRIKPPSDKALKVYRLRAVIGTKTQTELATKMTEQGVPATQGQVSKWLKEVEEAQAAGYILPDLPHLDGEPQSIDPQVLEMGKRQDGRTRRQRPCRDPDAD